MGVSLADRLETIASENNLTILQVKRLLKDVLTNPSVVNAFRQYMSGQLTLLEPETGEPSTSTRRHAHLLGFDVSSLGRRSSIMDLISNRTLTRSLAKQLRAEATNKGTFSSNMSSEENFAKHSLDFGTSRPKATTFLEMHFSEGEDEDGAENIAEKETGNAPALGTDDGNFHQRDEDYQPTADDFTLLQRDLYYDRDDVEMKSVSSGMAGGVEDEEDTLNDSLQTVEPFDSPHREYYLRSRKNDDIGMQNCCAGLTPSLLHMLDEYDVNFDADMDSTGFAEAISGPNRAADIDPEDQIYSNFLKSLYGSTPPEPSLSSPNFKEDTPRHEVGGSKFQNGVALSKSPSKLRSSIINDSKLTADDFDDPDFDVMAEIEAVCCDDLFDELRSDRAVRISKMEAKELRRDLVELFNEDYGSVDIDEDITAATTHPSMRKSHCAQAKSHDAMPSDNREFPPLSPPPFSHSINERLRRQLSMHVQLLCSTLACSINRVDLEASVCTLVQEAFGDIFSAFQEAKQDPYTYVTGLSDLNDLFAHACSFLFEFAGLTMLPRPPPNPAASTSYPPLLPLPFYLLDFIVRSPIWAYPRFLPRGLASRPHQMPKKNFTNDEDNLMVIGFANFIEFSPRRFSIFAESLDRRHKLPKSSEASTTTATGTSTMASRSKVFDFISKTLIPTRSKLQLHSRKAYMDKILHRDWLNCGPISKSSLYLLMLDLTSGNFEGLDEKRSLLRACVPSFAQKTCAAAEGSLQLGSVFSRPECWDNLPAEYALCCQALRTQMHEGKTGAPTPVLAPLTSMFPGDVSQIINFYSSAMLTWWPNENNPNASARVADVREVNAFQARPMVDPLAPNVVIVMPALGKRPVSRVSAKLPIPRLPNRTSPAQKSTKGADLVSRSPESPPLPSSSVNPLASSNAPLPGELSAPRHTCAAPSKPVNQVTPLKIPRFCHNHQSSSAGSRSHHSSHFLPQVGKTIQSFYSVLDRVLRGHAPPSRPRSSTPAALTARFLRRCRRNDTAWLPTSTAGGKEADESDVRRARCLLDRCRTHLGRQTHGDVIRALAEQPAVPLERILQLLSPSRPLWEEFVGLCLTPGQARSLHIYPIYAHLQRVRVIHSLLRASLPRAKRLWSGLRKLADSREAEELRIPAFQGAPHPSSDSSSPRSCNRRRTRKRRRRQTAEEEERQKPPKDVYKSAWSLLETALKDRYALHVQTAISLDALHKPYSNFPQTFEVNETLARRPSTLPEHSPSLCQGSSPPISLPRLVDEFASKVDLRASAFAESLQWEISTELSSRSSAAAKSKLANRCPCPCHDKSKRTATNAQAQVQQSGTSTGVVGKSASKADSLGLRHCIKCSLRVHQGVVYVDECNFHLTHVQITWPTVFSPRVESTDTCVYNPPSPQDDGSAVQLPSSCSTLQALHALGSYHESSCSGATVTSVVVPDMAGRQVSVNFGELLLPPSRKSIDVPVTPTVLSPMADKTSKAFTSAYSSSPPISPPPIFQLPPVDVDDEACFNTEAFTQRHKEESSLGVVASASEQFSSWSAAEDRRLLEHCRTAGRCSRRSLLELAAQWPERSPEELMARFKYLTLVAHGESYHSNMCTDSSQSDQDAEEDF
ncbi:unnamed protein product [Mesocestoides corti]|nr:unnamed protein product [Mesocestoides corti]